MKINCENCGEVYKRKRRNQKYCSASCRTMACYKRNKYEYVSGGYKKSTNELRAIKTKTENQLLPSELNSKLDSLIEKEEKIFDTKSITNSVASNLISDTAVYGIKKILNPNSLPATKGDIEQILLLINELRVLLVQMEFKDKFGSK